MLRNNVRLRLSTLVQLKLIRRCDLSCAIVGKSIPETWLLILSVETDRILPVATVALVINLLSRVSLMEH